jgi:hypothetical protein
MPPREAGAKAIRFALRAARGRFARWRAAGRCTYPDASGPDATGRLSRRLGALAPDAAALAALEPILGRLADRWLEHRFDLLGSGWVRIQHGAAYAGFGPHRYGPHAALPSDAWREAVAIQATPGNRARALAILNLIESPAYAPIDWHVDFKSGWRWDPAAWGPSSPYGHKPGIDIKLPWELARLQHLPGLALARWAGVTPQGFSAGQAVGDDACPLAAEFRNQALDFWAANPPGFGVNWACAMDVAIRAANIALAWDLFRGAGHAFDDAFERELGAMMLAHGRFVANHLEWHPSHRANHYLADVTGLAFAAAYLPSSGETDLWLAFCARALDAEIQRQFDGDGAGFEASTAYHRLAAELALYGVALMLGLPPERQRAIAACDPAEWNQPAPFPPAAGTNAWPAFSDATFSRLAGAARFAADCTRPSGAFVQIGDNDSGRLFKLTPSVAKDDALLAEQHLDMRPLIGAVSGLLDCGPALATPAGFAVERSVVSALAGAGTPRAVTLPPSAPQRRGTVSAPTAAPDSARRVERVRFPLADAGVLTGLAPCFYPAFGLYIWRGPRAFVSIRCGPVGQNGNGGHAHNDALAVEIELDGVALASDPGTFVYTADLAARDRWRSVMAHFAPRDGTREPARLLAPFRLEDKAMAEALAWDGSGFVGRHAGFGWPVYRRIEIRPHAITVEDRHGGWTIGPETKIRDLSIETPAELIERWPLGAPFSAGYGLAADAPPAGSMR